MNKIGLCMIVKNESKVIKRCLDSVKPLIDYVCISDTGSTDDTVQIILQWMKENNIKGEVNKENWKNFAFNRTKSLENLRKHKDIDYALVIDADEILKFDENFDFINFKNNLTSDLYHITCKFGNIEYVRTSLFKNNKKFYYKGVLHEYLECNDPFITKNTATGIYNIPIQDSARNKNTKKYQDDAIVLENALKTEVDPFLIQRYTFYLAQSYKDCEQNGKAIYWYNKRAELGGWDQEIYWSLYQVARLKEIMGYPEDDIVQSYLRAYEKCTTRIEALHNTIKFCRTHGRDHQAYMIGKYAKTLPVDKNGLFVESWMWDYGLDDEFSVCCYWTGHYEEGLKVCEDLINKIPEDQKPRIQQNINYFKEKLVL
jgi:glycosyltransferase involved in cell wall biosynthesis